MKAFAAALLSAAVAVPAAAQMSDTVKVSDRHGVVTATEMLKNGKHVEKITCRTFNAFDETFKPQAVSYAIDYGKRKNPKDVVMDVTGSDRITPVVVETCKAHPEETLMQRIKAAFHHG